MVLYLFGLGDFWGCKLTRSASSLQLMLALPQLNKDANFTKTQKRLSWKSSQPSMTLLVSQMKSVGSGLSSLEQNKTRQSLWRKRRKPM
jgi:hypothetical protein